MDGWRFWRRVAIFRAVEYFDAGAYYGTDGTRAGIKWHVSDDGIATLDDAEG